MKFSSPKISSQRYLILRISPSSIEIKQTPSSASKFAASRRRGYIIFSQLVWFKTESAEEIHAYSQFIERLCKTAQAKTRVTTTAPESFDNEKFSMRVWLISLDIKGSQYALSRKLLMSKLDGNSGYAKPPQMRS